MMNRKSVLGMVVGTLIPVGAALATIGACVIPTNSTCCEGWYIPCSGKIPYPAVWFCDIQSTGSVNVIVGVPTPSGYTGRHLAEYNTWVGSCTISPQTCGPSHGSCIPGTPYTMNCYDSEFYGFCYVP